MEINSINNKESTNIELSELNNANPHAEVLLLGNDEAKERDEKGPWVLWSQLTSSPTNSRSEETVLAEEILTRYSDNPKNWSALNYAIDQGDYESAVLLIKFVRDINHVDAGHNALHRIFIRGMKPAIRKLSDAEIELVNALIVNGAEVRWDKKSDYSPLEVASYMGLDEIVRELLNKGAHPDEPQGLPLHFAVDKSNYKIVELLVQAKANLDPPTLGNSPLSTATRKGDLKMVELLLKSGSNPNAKNIQGGTSILGIALRNKAEDPTNSHKAEIVELLLQHAAKLL